MKRLKIFSIVLAMLAVNACKDQLDVKNPNNPTPASAQTERGIVNFAQGAIYVSGFYDLKFYDGVPGRFWTGAIGFHELMGDIVGEEAANIYGNQIGCPDLVTLTGGSQVPNPQSPSTQKGLLKLINVNAQQGSNPLYYEWAYMYAMNNGSNQILALVDGVKFSGDAATKANVVKAWAYFWKGYAYSRIGSMYIAGLIIDKPLATNNNYVVNTAILAEAENNFAKAESILGSLSSGGDYDAILGGLIPSFNQVGSGGILTPAMWIRNINTMRARNVLVNNKAASMSSAQWTSVLNYANNGIKSSDLVFTLRSNTNADLMSPTSGNIPAKTYGSTAQGGTFKVSERLIQEFKAGDLRLPGNFKQTATWIGNSDRGNSFNTRWALLDGGNGNGAVAMCDRSTGGYELYIGGSYVENELMKAEANINLGNVDAGLASVDGIRTLQGSGLTAVSGTGLTQTQAKDELRRERRIALAFRGFSFYDARRWDVLANGRTGCVVVDKAGNVDTNATIKYGFFEYWDVPDNELAYNAASSATASVVKQ